MTNRVFLRVIYGVVFSWLSVANAMEEKKKHEECSKNTPELSLELVKMIDSGELLEAEINTFNDALKMISKILTEEVIQTSTLLKIYLEKENKLKDEKAIKESRVALQAARFSLEKLIKKLSALKQTMYDKILTELNDFRFRLLSRENFYYRLQGVPYRILKYTKTTDLKRPMGGYQEEDAIKTWNPGYLSSGCLTELVDFYKKKKEIGNLSAKDAFDFYSWADLFVFQIRSGQIEISNEDRELRILKSKCKFVKETTRYSTGSLKIYFTDQGTAHSPRMELSKEEEKICQKVIFPSKGKKIRYVYPLDIDPEPKIYNLSQSGELYIDMSRQGGHVNILKGEPLVSAGEISFKDNKIFMLNNNSGHYKPTIKDLILGYLLLVKNYGKQIFHKDFTLVGFDPPNKPRVLDKKEYDE
jgi:hypothetical protein